jgi:hypothetical protein
MSDFLFSLTLLENFPLSSHIEKMIEEGAKLEKLTKKEQEQLVTIGKVYEQQLEMYKKKT